MYIDKGKKIAVFIEEMYNEHEFWYPKYRLLEAGATVIVAGSEAGKEYRSKVGMPAKADVSFADLQADDLDGLLIPGGYAPDFMRRSKACLELVRKINEQKKLIAFICHAGWVPVSAGILQGRTVTSHPAIRDDVQNAGATWKDEVVVEEGNFISSRTPADLPDFMRAVVAWYGC